MNEVAVIILFIIIIIAFGVIGLYVDVIVEYLVDSILYCCRYKKKATIIVPKEIISEYVIVINPGNQHSIGIEY
jgi:hypothetical protein